MQLDTGSSDTWVRGSACIVGPADLSSGRDSCKGPKFNTSDPAISRIGQAKFETEYGTGLVKGDIYKGEVGIGGVKASIPFGVSTFEEGFDHNVTFDGLIGLGFDSISTISGEINQSASFVDGLGFSSSSNIFSFYFSNAKDGADKGEVSFGGYNVAKFTGDITWLPLTDQSYWQFKWTGATVKVGSESFSAVDASESAVAGMLFLFLSFGFIHQLTIS